MRRKLSLITAIVVGITLLASACSAVTTQVPASAASAVVTVHGGVIATPLPVPAAAKQPAPYNIYRGPNTTRYVIPTYDDCPRSVKEFKTMVDYASSDDKALALFPTGDCIKQYKTRGFNLVGYARERGVWVANHSISHPLLTRLSVKAAVKQISGTAVSNYGRPPYGGVDADVRKAYKSVSSYSRHGMRIWTWTVDTNDWKPLSSGSRPSSALIVKRALASVKAGGTILMHMQHKGFNPKTLQALEKGLAKKGLKLCKAWHGEDRTGPIEATGRVIPDNIC